MHSVGELLRRHFLGTSLLVAPLALDENEGLGSLSSSKNKGGFVFSARQCVGYVVHCQSFEDRYTTISMSVRNC